MRPYSAEDFRRFVTWQRSWHDHRHTLVTGVAASRAGDEAITSTRHVSSYALAVLARANRSDAAHSKRSPRASVRLMESVVAASRSAEKLAGFLKTAQDLRTPAEMLGSARIPVANRTIITAGGRREQRPACDGYSYG